MIYGFIFGACIGMLVMKVYNMKVISKLQNEISQLAADKKAIYNELTNYIDKIEK